MCELFFSMSELQLIDLLFPEMETSEKTDLPNEYDTAYGVPFKLTIGPGRKSYDISKEQVEYLRSLFFSWTKIAAILQVNISTLQRRRKEFGLSDELEQYSVTFWQLQRNCWNSSNINITVC